MKKSYAVLQELGLYNHIKLLPDEPCDERNAFGFLSVVCMIT